MEIEQGAGRPVTLRVTNNASTMLSVKYPRNGAEVRLSIHHMFLRAPDDVRHALAAWVKNPKVRKAGRLLNEFIAGHRDEIEPKPPRPVEIQTKGCQWNLQVIYDEVNAEHFNNRITTPITWGRMPAKSRRRSIRFGSFSPADNLIRIHPLLDQPWVPRYFVRYIVFHEMLHALLGIEERPSGRRSIHPPHFKKAEAAYPDFARALAWMGDSSNLRRLLGGRGRRPAE